MSSMCFEVSLDKLKFVFPRSLLEICYIIQQDLNAALSRERTDELLSMDLNDQYTKPFQIHSYSDDRICFQFTTTRSYFEEDFLCVHIDSLQPTDPVLTRKLNDLPQPFNYPLSASFTDDLRESRFSSILPETILNKGISKSPEKVPRVSQLAALAAGLPGQTAEVSSQYSDQSTQTELCQETISSTLDVDRSTQGITVIKRKRGRPRKVDKPQDENTDIPAGEAVHKSTYIDAAAETTEIRSKAEKEKISEDSNIKVTPRGRIVRKPAWFRDVHDIDDALKIADPDIELYDETETDSDPDYHTYQIQHSDIYTQSDTEERQLPDSQADLQDGDKKIKKRRHASDDENITKPHHGSRGQKRRNYKREPNIPCKYCPKLYKDKSSLIAHVNKFHSKCEGLGDYLKELKDSNRISCNVCGKLVINRSTDINNHMLRVHGTDDNFISKCDECGLEFKRSFLLTEHKKRAHPKHERILCHLCPASFKIKAYLTEHLKYKHNETVKWKCDVCHKLFSTPKNLIRHRKLHQAALYSCHLCHKMFHDRNNLKRHVLYVHESHRLTKHMCEQCGKEFNSRKLLQQHINYVHVKTSSFYCDICKKYFIWKKDLINHATTYHPGTPILSTNNADLYHNGIQHNNQDSMVQPTECMSTLNENQTSNSTIIIQSAVSGGQQSVEVVSEQADMSQYEESVGYKRDGSRSEMTSSLIIDSSGSGLPPSIDVNSIQQAIAAIEQANGSFTEGGERYISVIDADGNEIMVEIVNNSTEEMQFPGMISEDQPTIRFTSDAAVIEPSTTLQHSATKSHEQKTVSAVDLNPTEVANNTANSQTATDPATMVSQPETVQQQSTNMMNSNFEIENQTLVSTANVTYSSHT